MKTLLKIVLLICISWLLAYNLDWRFSLLMPFIVIVFVPHRYVLIDLMVGVVSIFLVWVTAALIIDGGNNSILSSRLAGLFGLPNGPTLVMVTGALGGILGGMGALTGHFLHKSFQNKEQ